MQRIYRQISFERKQDVYCVRLRGNRLEEEDILAMAEELLSLIQDQGCRKMIFCLGPGVVDCLYSVLLATLVSVRRKLSECGGVLKLCEVSPQTLEVFEACRLQKYFDFEPDQAAAVRALASVSA
jgi:anti-anti-sigma factor